MNALTAEQIEIIQEFVNEVQDLLEELEPSILGLEKISTKIMKLVAEKS